LDGEGLDMLAEASWWTAQPAENLAARARVHPFFGVGDKRRAPMAALWLVRDYSSKGASAVAQA
jgi:hypothetical protein